MAAKNGQQAVAVAQGTLPEGYDLEDIMGDAGAGQNMGAGDLGIPFIAILQSNSPQVNPGHAKYIEGAQAGMFMNTATGEVFDGRKEGITLIPAAYQRDYDEWRDRDAGEGGFVASHSVNSDIMTKTRPNAKGKPALSNGNVIWETAKQFCLFRNPSSGRVEQILFTMKSTHLKANKRWNNLIAGAMIPGTDKQAPRWLYPYNVKTLLETKGSNSFFVPVIERIDVPVTKDEYTAARAFHLAHVAGQVNVTPPAEDEADIPAEGGSKDGDDKIPY